MVAQALDAREAVEIVERLAQAESRQDVAAAMAVCHPDGVLESPSLGSRYVGAEVEGAITRWFAFSVPVFILFRFRDGRVGWESFHFDVAGVARQCGVEAAALVGAS